MDKGKICDEISIGIAKSREFDTYDILCGIKYSLNANLNNSKHTFALFRAKSESKELKGKYYDAYVESKNRVIDEIKEYMNAVESFIVDLDNVIASLED